MSNQIFKIISSYLKDEWYSYYKKEITTKNLTSNIEVSSISIKINLLQKLYLKCKECKKCNLYSTATNLVFGDGNPNTNIMFIGEAPGADEDLQGKPFVGRAGKLLTSTIEELGYKRESFYIANVLKHRPPENRSPSTEEIQACSPYLIEQINIIKPKLIITLGNFSLKLLSNNLNAKITTARGIYFNSIYGYMVLPTYHPAAILRNINLLEDFKRDLKKGFEEFNK